MKVDYDEYAEGEALLGWLNVSSNISGDEFDGNELLVQLAASIRQELVASQIEIAHLKMTLMPDSGNDLAVGNLVRTQGTFELSHHLAEPLENGDLIINLRAEGDPDELQQIVQRALHTHIAERNLTESNDHVEAFRPGRPVPTHRLAGTIPN